MVFTLKLDSEINYVLESVVIYYLFFPLTKSVRTAKTSHFTINASETWRWEMFNSSIIKSNMSLLAKETLISFETQKRFGDHKFYAFHSLWGLQFTIILFIRRVIVFMNILYGTFGGSHRLFPLCILSRDVGNQYNHLWRSQANLQTISNMIQITGLRPM